MDTKYIDRDTSSLIRQPNSRHCFVCGLESPVGLKLRFDDNGNNEVRALYSVGAEYQGYPGVVHGGIVAAMLDEIGGRVPMAGAPDRFMVTAKLAIRYRRPVPTETPLTLVGHLLKDQGRLAVAHSEIRLPDGTVAAEAEVTLAQIPKEYVPNAGIDELGWRVYPD
ncbi:MAG: PaaI family thioesterase [Anaerolineae bacterium]|nr:PaaI family thioesterase [Anaerolineae bacterium]